MITLQKSFLLAFLIMGLTFVSCKKDDPKPEPEPGEATFTVTVENIMEPAIFPASGETGLLMPGESMMFRFHAGRGSYLSFATMFVQSNDLFYAFDETGLALYDGNGDPVTGDVTAEVDLWDAGTEVNEEPGVGPNQAPRQAGPDTGPDENGTVALVNDGFSYPADETVIRVTLSHDGGTEFTATIENISGGSTLPSPLAPGVWVIHDNTIQLFTAGEAADEGLEGIAEDGNNAATLDFLQSNTGYVSPFAPGVFLIHEGGRTPIFEDGRPDFGDGLEALAEDGDPGPLNTSLGSAEGVSEHGVFNTPQGDSGPGPLFPGNSYTFSFTAEEGAYLNLATMLVQTNDLFFAFADGGLALFNGMNPVSGDVTSEILLWDSGTEVNEYPGAGNNQPVRGGGNSGPAENGNVQEVNDGFTYPAVNEMIRVTIRVQ